MKEIPILILHGWNLSSSYYDKLVNRLKSYGYKVRCFDLPGFGKSRLPRYPLTLRDYVDYVVQKVKLDNFTKVIIVGHSFGGRIGIKLAAEYPNLVHALILTGTPGINPVTGIKILFFRIIAKTGKIILSIPLISPLKPTMRKLLHRVAGAYDYSQTKGIMRITFNNIIREDLKIYMTKLNLPTLLLWGENDRIVPFKIAIRMSKLIYGSELYKISSCGHGIVNTCAKEFADKLIAFLSKK